MLGTEPEMSERSQVDDATIAALAKQTHLPHDVVKKTYDEEIVALHCKREAQTFRSSFCRPPSQATLEGDERERALIDLVGESRHGRTGSGTGACVRGSVRARRQ